MLTKTCIAIVNPDKLDNPWETVFYWSEIGHLIMWMDAVHAAIGLVRSNWATNALQIASRNLVNFIYFVARNVFRCTSLFSFSSF